MTMIDVFYKNARKVNIPYSKDLFKKGMGEKVWVLFLDDAIKAYKNDGFGTFTGILLNNTYVFPDLKEGKALKIEFRGKKSPVAVYNELSRLQIDKNSISTGHFWTHKLPDALYELDKQR